MTRHTATYAPPAGLDDAQLMARVQRDDQEAFGILYDRLSRRAYAVALGSGHDRARADDVVQEAFASIWRSRAGYRPDRGTVSAWMVSTVRHRAIDALRANGRHDRRRSSDEGVEERFEASGDVAQDVVERQQAAQLRTLMVRLPDAQREVLTLAYFGELSATEISRELELPLGTVKGRIRLGLQRLRDEMALDEQFAGITLN